ncbi:MAG: hypothetical protein R2799_04845 [Crocinitomicaceae bacterium]
MNKKGGVDINQIEIEPYCCDTLLSDGYYLSYRVKKDTLEKEFFKSLTLKKRNIEIKLLNELNYKLPDHNLGFIMGDFGKSFIYVQSFGAGNPYYFQLIEKKSGKELKNGILIDHNEEEQILLYFDKNDKNRENILLYDFKKRKIRTIKEFENSQCEYERIGGIRSCLEIDTVTSSHVILKIETDKERISKSYSR